MVARARSWGGTDAELMAPWTLRRGAQEFFTMPKASCWRTFVMNHLIHHRGQLTVYLRELDVRCRRSTDRVPTKPCDGVRVAPAHLWLGGWSSPSAPR
jgi:hypothetical protein